MLKKVFRLDKVSWDDCINCTCFHFSSDTKIMISLNLITLLGVVNVDIGIVIVIETIYNDGNNLQLPASSGVGRKILPSRTQS